MFGRIEICREPDSCFPIENPFPRFPGIRGERTDCADAGDDDAPGCNGLGHLSEPFNELHGETMEEGERTCAIGRCAKRVSFVLIISEIQAVDPNV